MIGGKEHELLRHAMSDIAEVRKFSDKETTTFSIKS
jgi:hypothetical protein